MGEQEYKTKIFLSCGQSGKKKVKNFGDKSQKEVAEEIKKYIEEKFKERFYVYMAGEQSGNETVLEGIFHELMESEYLLFIDFLEGFYDCFHKKNGYGSLFSNQEVAVAYALGIQVCAIRQKGIKRDGVLNYIQQEFKSFNDEEELYNIIEKKLENWPSDWKNKLSMAVGDVTKEFINRSFLYRLKDGEEIHPICDFYHINVQNEHHRKIARNCYGYVTKIINMGTNESLFEKPLKSIEVKWAGSMLPNATILNKKNRELDAFFAVIDERVIKETKHPIIAFNTLTDSDEYRYRITKKGCYEITYLVISDNFRQEEKKFYLELGNTAGDIKFTDDLGKIGEYKDNIASKNDDSGQSEQNVTNTTGLSGTLGDYPISGNRIR